MFYNYHRRGINVATIATKNYNRVKYISFKKKNFLPYFKKTASV